jgi:hypothetical protein
MGGGAYRDERVFVAVLAAALGRVNDRYQLQDGAASNAGVPERLTGRVRPVASARGVGDAEEFADALTAERAMLRA